MSGMFFQIFLFILTQISLYLISLGSAKAHIDWGGKLNGNLMASCVRNIRTKNYQKSDDWFLSYRQKCQGCFLRHSV